MPKERKKETPDEAAQFPKGIKPWIPEVDPLRPGMDPFGLGLAPGKEKRRPSEPRLVDELASTVREIQLQLGKQMEIRSKDIDMLIKESDRLQGLINSSLGATPTLLRRSLDQNLQAVKKHLGHNDDLVIREFRVGEKSNLRAAIVYIDGLVTQETINEQILRPLMLFSEEVTRFTRPVPAKLYLSIVKRHVLTISDVKERHRLDDLLDSVASGETALLLDGIPLTLVLGTRGRVKRSISEPVAEAVIRGPRDGFVETLQVNVAQVRHRIRDANLRVNVLHLGRRTQTEVAVMHIDGIANRLVVKEVFQRLQSMDVDAVLESGYIEQVIEDHHMSPFPQVLSTERPDKVTANLLEGRVTIMTDGTPFALIVPATFNQFYQSPEDYYERWIISSLLRVLRTIAVFFSLTATALYVALISFHPEMIPTSFAIAVAGGRAGVPVPSIVEALLMETTMEILREASVRLPRPIGPTLGIVGALVIGEAATRAGLVSPLMVIVVAVASIGSFAVPSYSAAIALRILKFPIIIASSMFGLYGVMVFMIGIVIHLSSMESLGVPYLSPFSPFRPSDMKDTLLRAPLWMMTRRPQGVQPKDDDRLPHKAEPIRGLFDMEQTLKGRFQGKSGKSRPGKGGSEGDDDFKNH